LVAAAPAFASVLTTSPNAGSSVLPGAVTLQSDLLVKEVTGYDLQFRINGWEARDAMAADERMWISINQSWRATWR
jgi:hypothetical protein